MHGVDPPMLLRSRVEDLLGPTSSWRPVAGGYTSASRYVVRADSGGFAFVKAATDELTSEWLRTEHAMLSTRASATMPAVLAWDGRPGPVLVIEDLSHADWPPPWTGDRVRRCVAALREMHRAIPPDGLPRLAAERTDISGWSRVADDPDPFLALNVVTDSWLHRRLPLLVELSANASLDGTALLHCDVRSDNIAFAGDRTVLVDWDRCMIGNPLFDLAFWAPSLRGEGGPPPEEIVGQEPELAALVAGFFAARAGLPPPHPGSTVRALQRAQLVVALEWVCRVASLPEASA